MKRVSGESSQLVCTFDCGCFNASLRFPVRRTDIGTRVGWGRGSKFWEGLPRPSLAGILAKFTTSHWLDPLLMAGDASSRGLS